ncbi:phosphate regulon sensor histidine kinase PhoR [Nitrogeniibacter aestuarii]|uniref:phosphate regulon sensor histidine kinase PhoR n=1 Tax=Nitrogeniibacter aestuarii TaxID=2815343 RepID=UPI0022AA42B6|nr:phosphate regulon sensor histidine kinase PhoR [Nitrogeniibacter aestuarii]
MAAVTLFAVPVALLVSPLVGAIVAAIGVLLILVRHNLYLTQLVQWTHEPIGTPLPHAFGVWDFVFSDLNRRSRQASEARERLSAALDRFREASQAMPDGVMYLSHTGTIEWMNYQASIDFSLDEERDRGAQVTNLVRQPDFVHYLDKGHYDEPFLFHPIHRKGAALLVQVIRFGDHRKMVISRDVSHIEKLETMRRDFVANVSHELRTPLTVVGGFLETVIDAEDDLDLADRNHYLGLALEQSGRMRRLINDLLTLSALETGAPQPAEELFDVGGIVREIGRETEALSGGRHTVVVEVDCDCKCQGSPKELHSAFANLASNAVRYTPDGGTVTLSWQLGKNGVGKYCVRDTGIGIAPEHIPRLTERFYRVDRGRSRETGGTGLGLAIVKHVLTRHQCEMKISSRLGQGSEFCVIVPAARIVSCDRPS